MTTFWNPKALRLKPDPKFEDTSALGCTSPTETKDSRNENLRRIYHISFLLRQKLVPDVIPAIIHDAGMFERHAYRSTNVQPLVVREESAPQTCIVTLPIRSSARAKHPVRKVVFAIQAKDQGWCDNVNGGSWTWFTAGVVKADPGSLTSTNNGEQRLDREKQVTRNELAQTAPIKTRFIEWTVDSPDPEQRRWISDLENGDRIAVRAWAQFAGWENTVKNISITIYTAAVV